MAAAAFAKQLPTRSLARAADDAFRSFARLTSRRHLLTPSAAAAILREALDEKVHSSTPRRGKLKAGLTPHEIGWLYADHSGLREVVAVTGGLKKLMELRGSRHGLAFDSGNLILEKGPRSSRHNPSAADPPGRVAKTSGSARKTGNANSKTTPSGADAEPDSREIVDVVIGLRALVKAQGGRADEDTVTDALRAEPRFVASSSSSSSSPPRSAGEVVEAHGGLEAFLGANCKDLLWRTSGELISVEVLLAEATEASPHSVLTSQQFAELCSQYPKISFEDHLVYLENSGSKWEKENKNAAKEKEYQRWRQERLVEVLDAAGLQSESLNLWYGEACLVCLQHCPLEQFKHHSKSKKHQDNYWGAGGYALKSSARTAVADSGASAVASTRWPPNVLPKERRAGGRDDVDGCDSLEIFWDASGLSRGRVLVLGEADFSFSAAVASRRQHVSEKEDSDKAAPAMVATTFFSRHDPEEPEVCLSRGRAIWYPRRSLSSFGGLLTTHLDTLEAANVEVLYDVDATNLSGTLSPRVDGSFDTVVFPFPQASPCSDAQNAILLRGFLRNVESVLEDSPHSRVQIMILESQYVDWDIDLMAQEANLVVDAWLPLPSDLYTIRFLAGKAWRPENAVFVSFKLGHFAEASAASEELLEAKEGSASGGTSVSNSGEHSDRPPEPPSMREAQQPDEEEEEEEAFKSTCAGLPGPGPPPSSTHRPQAPQRRPPPPPSRRS